MADRPPGVPQDAEEISIAGFNRFIGPLYRLGDGGDGSTKHFVFVVIDKHMNAAGTVHGGMLMTLADQAMAFTARKHTRKAHATMELHIHFVGVVRVGEFVEVRTEVVRATRSVVFLEAKMFVGDRLVVAASGIWKIIGEP